MLSYILRIEVVILDFFVTFFRDVLDGPLYTGVAITCGILICSCIGYLGEQYLDKFNVKEDTKSESVSSDVSITADSTVQNAVNVNAVETQVIQNVEVSNNQVQ